MAQAADDARATPADTVATSVATGSVRPRNYKEFYAKMTDILGQQYAPLYHRHKTDDPDQINTAEELYDLTVTSSHVIPKVYLCHTSVNGEAAIEVLHRVFRYDTHPLETSQWDGEGFCFMGDIMKGNAINVRKLPHDMFDITNVQRVPTIAAMDPLVQSLAAGVDYIPAPAVGAADTCLVTTRSMIQVPHKYVHLVINKTFGPKQLWRDLAGAIQNDGKADELSPLLDWLSVTCTQEDADGTPTNYLGPKAEVLPPLDVDAKLQECIWKVLTHDLSLLGSPESNPSTTSDPTTKVVEVMREENALARAERAVERADREKRDAARKTPSGAHPSFVNKWMRNCDVAREEELEPVYHRWAVVKQGERRLELQAAVDERAAQPSAAGRHPPIVTKEITEITFFGNLGSRPSQVNDLSKGVSPFTCGFIAGSSPAVEVRIDKYDSTMTGNSQPTVAEVESFSTKEIPLPTSTYECGSMLKATSLVLDTIQGPTNPHAQCFRQFIVDDWPDIEDMLQQSREPATIGNVLPRILRSVQINMTTYLHSVFMGAPAALPRYHELKDIVRLQEWSKLQHLPIAYLIPRDNPQSSGSGKSSRGETSEDTTNGGLGARDEIQESDRHQAWMDAFKTSKRTLQEVRKGTVPTTINKDTRKQVQICLSYHLKGFCYQGCTRKDTHRKLTTSETKDMDTFVQTECKKE